MSGVLAPPPIFSPVQDVAGVIVPIWQAFFVNIAAATAGASTAPVLVTTATPSFPASVNLGLLSTGFLKTTPTAGVATITSVATIPATNGGTGQSTVTTGDLLYGSAANTWSKLADVATGNALISGGVTTAPAWGKIGLTTHVSGTLPIANGGTNATSQTTSGIAYFDSSKITSSANATLDGSGNLFAAGTLTVGTSAFLYTPSAGSLVLRGVSGSTTIFDVASFGSVEIFKIVDAGAVVIHGVSGIATPIFDIVDSGLTVEIFKCEDNGRSSFGGPMNLKNYTVATLPAGTRGDVAYATDLLLPGFLAVAVGGGAVVGPVFFDGANWVSF